MNKVIIDKRRHGLSIIMLDDAGKSWHRSRGGLFRKETKNTDHGKTAVVDLRDKPGLLLLLRHIFGKSKGIVEVERHIVRHALRPLEVGEVAGFAARHVVLSSELAPPFEEEDDAEDLGLSVIGDGVPEGGRVGDVGEGGSVELHGPGEVDAVGGGYVANEGEHGDAAMFDFGVANPSNGGLVGVSPEFSVRETDGVVESDDGVTLLGKDLEIGLGFHIERRLLDASCYGR
mmetsp:Transcript_28060/g.64237  ORF Transcript_28060/g.64237 Transcript_28060/m.64237 type:complete len:231 (-) Transcript_28060:159-851(-)